MARPLRIVQLTDWLPPRFSAVSQYAIQFGEEMARDGKDVTVIGLGEAEGVLSCEAFGAGSLTIVSVACRDYDKHDWNARLRWSLAANFALVRKGWRRLREADQIRFTGSPPFLLFFVAAANLLLRKRLVYRITDFYPEVIAAAMRRPHWRLRLLETLTDFVRRRVHLYEAIGVDMQARLLAKGIARERIVLRRDRSPVAIDSGTRPLERPALSAGRRILLYSGNFGVAHEAATFLQAYVRHHREGTGSTFLWLNATGAGADALERELEAAGVPFVRDHLVPLDRLGALLATPDAHLITLRPNFAGLVLPSKVYACLESRKPILYVGPPESDIHFLCASAANPYHRADPGDVASVQAFLDRPSW